jgi:hypothetical protein
MLLDIHVVMMIFPNNDSPHYQPQGKSIHGQ